MRSIFQRTFQRHVKTIAAPDITVRHPTKAHTWIWIEGGWDLRVPEIEPDEESLRAYARYFAQDMPLYEALAYTRTVLQRVFESAFVKGVKDAIARRACEYVERYGDLEEPAMLPRTSRRFVRLRGFDAEQVQATYVPHDNTGRPGKRYVRDLLDVMAHEARAQLELFPEGSTSHDE